MTPATTANAISHSQNPISSDAKAYRDAPRAMSCRTAMSDYELKARWSTVLARRFDVASVETFFGVSERTAYYWFDQRVLPSAPALIRFMQIATASEALYLTGETNALD